MAEIEQEANKAASQISKKSSAGFIFCLGFGLMLGAAGCFYDGTVGTADARAQSADYHRAPGCTPYGVRSSGLPPCQLQTMTVTAKNQIDEGDEMPDTYKLGLRTSAGAEQTVTLVGPETMDLFAHVAIGSTVQVKTWQGQILILTIPGWHCGTPDHPDVQVDSGNKFLVLGGFLTLAGGGAFFYGGRAYKNRNRDFERKT